MRGRFAAPLGAANAKQPRIAQAHRYEALRADTTTVMSEIVTLVFGQAGLRVGITMDGTKYTRIFP